MEINPNNPTPIQNSAVIYNLQGKNEEAIKYYKMLIKINDNDPEIYYGIAMVYQNMDLPEEATDNMCKAYNIYVKTKSPYQSDAETLLNQLNAVFKKQGKEQKFIEILQANNISPQKEK